jgi:hypothetical protein
MENENIIQSTSNPIPTPDQPEIQPVSNSLMSQKDFLPLLLGVFAFLVVVAGGTYYLGTQTDKTTHIVENTNIQPTLTIHDNIATTTIPTTILTIKPQIAETTKWKTYANKLYGFETKYNSELKATEESGGTESIGQFTFLLTVTFSSGYSNTWHSQNGYEVEISNKSLTGYRTEIVGHIADKIDSEQAITVNGNVWTKINYKIFATTDYVLVTKAVINHRGYGYAVTASTLDIDEILSAFKFTD